MAERYWVQAKEKLRENPFDGVHGYAHHQRVARNAARIIKGEGLIGEIDVETFFTALWWHDYSRGDSDVNHAAVTQSMASLSACEEQIGTVLTLIDSHSIDVERSRSIPEQVLFDADKIDYVDPRRYAEGLEALKDGRMTAEQLNGYKKKRIIPYLAGAFGTLHYDTARELYRDNLAGLGEYVVTVPEYADIAEFMASDPGVQELLEYV